MNNGFITIQKKIEKSAIYHSSVCVHLVLHCLIKANWEEKTIIFNQQRITLKRGDFLTGRKILAKEIYTGEQKLRTSLKILENIGFLTIKATNKFSEIFI